MSARTTETNFFTIRRPKAAPGPRGGAAQVGRRRGAREVAECGWDRCRSATRWPSHDDRAAADRHAAARHAALISTVALLLTTSTAWPVLMPRTGAGREARLPPAASAPRPTPRRSKRSLLCLLPRPPHPTRDGGRSAPGTSCGQPDAYRVRAFVLNAPGREGDYPPGRSPRGPHGGNASG